MMWKGRTGPYTGKELIGTLESLNISVTSDQLDRWRTQGLFSGVHKAMPRGRGRPPLLYPDYALDAAIWLSRYYKHVRSPVSGRQWLWALGLRAREDIIDPDDLIVRYVEAMWTDLRLRVPSLPTLAEAISMREDGVSSVSEVLDQWDERITRIERECIGIELLHATGLIPAEDIVATDEINDDSDYSYANSFVNVIKLLCHATFGIYCPTDTLKSIHLLEDPTLTSRLNVVDLYKSAQNGTLDWGFIRLFLRNALLPAAVVGPTAIPQMGDSLKTFYVYFTPVMVMAGLASASVIMTEKEKNAAIELVQEMWFRSLGIPYPASLSSQAQKAPLPKP